MDHLIKILLLEHDENDIGLILHELKKSNINFVSEVVSARNEYENALGTFIPNIILSDYSLPSFDGITAFEIKEKINPEIPFIIISGIVGEEKAVEMIKQGITDYVLKDKLFTLSGKITRALKESQQKYKRNIAEKELKESQKRLAEAQMIARIGNWAVDLVTGFEYWSDEVYNIMGLEPNELKPSLKNFLSFIHPDQRFEVKEKIDQATKKQSAFSYSTTIIRKDGSVAYIYSNGKYIFDPQGKAIRLIGILQDVTETKKMEEELKAANKELETFIYRASHDLRGPLSSIIGLTNVSKSEIRDAASKKYFEMVEASAQKLDATLISLVQSMTMRDMTIKLEEINFNELVRDILSQLKYHDGFSNIEIVLNNNFHDKYQSNKLVLSSIFQNLIQNAIKYQNYHNGLAYLHITINKKSQGLEIIFEDNGIGVDDHLQDKIFDMYFRGTSSASGSGLGLYIVKIGIEKLNGTIRFKSTKGEGTRFTIYLRDPD
jgi:two-component system sensor histidine kinase UhpB